MLRVMDCFETEFLYGSVKVCHLAHLFCLRTIGKYENAANLRPILEQKRRWILQISAI